MANDLVPSDPGEFLFYQTEDGRTRLQVRMEGETVWYSQKAMADVEVIISVGTSIDYDPGAGVSNLFFQTVQNKVHWAIVGQTAAEIVHARASAAKPQMGLTSWSGGRPHMALDGIGGYGLCRPMRHDGESQTQNAGEVM